MTIEVFLIEDDDAIRESIAQTFMLAGWSCRPFVGARDALEALQRGASPKVVVTDVKLKDLDGLQFLKSARSIDPDLPVIVITGHGDVPMAVEAMRSGAFDFLLKPFSSARIVASVRAALTYQARDVALPDGAAADTIELGLVGISAATRRLRAMVQALAKTSVDVLLVGETGTGKEVVARALHEASGRPGPFVAVNCCALPEAMFEGEMFGHEAGAFAGAQHRRLGKLEYAREGTVLLDEIESMPLALQAKLLRAIQERSIERLGSNEPVPIDCRFVAATQVDLLTAASQGTFRSDLYYRLELATLRLPPLRERIEDLPVLVERFVADAASRHGTPRRPVLRSVLAEWSERPWNGNVRELRNAVERWCLGLDAVAVGREDDGDEPSTSLSEVIADTERRCIAAALRACGGRVQDAAARLGIPRKTLYDKLLRLGIDARRFRDPARPSGTLTESGSHDEGGEAPDAP